MKTTVYIPDDLKLALSRVAKAANRSEADLIRQSIADLVERSSPPRPRGALFSSGDPSLSERVDEAIAGFGEH